MILNLMRQIKDHHNKQLNVNFMIFNRKFNHLRLSMNFLLLKKNPNISDRIKHFKYHKVYNHPKI